MSETPYKPPEAPDQGGPHTEIMTLVAMTLWRADNLIRYGWEVDEKLSWPALTDAERNSWIFYARHVFLTLEHADDPVVMEAGGAALEQYGSHPRGQYVMWGAMLRAAQAEKPF